MAKGYVSAVDGGTGAITAITLTSNGSGYVSAPSVSVDTGHVYSVTVGGSGTAYVNGDTLTFTTAGSTKSATGYIVVNAAGNVTKAVVTSGGVGYTSVPTVGKTSLYGSGNTFTAVSSHGASASLTAVLGTPANGKGTNRILFRYAVATNETATSDQITFTSPVGSVGTTTWSTVDSSVPGTGAAASAVVASGVTSYTMTNNGSGYTSAPSVQVTSATGTGATAVAILDQGLDVPTGGIGGKGYQTAPTVTVTPATGGAAVTSHLGTTGIVSDITIGGMADVGVVNGAAITPSGGTGSGFAGTVTVVGGDITGVTITNPGSYTSAPTLSVVGMTNRTLTPVLGYPIASYTVTPGTGYTNTSTGASIIPTLSVAAPAATSGTTTAAVGLLRLAVTNPTATLVNLQTVATVQPVTVGHGYVAASAVFSGGGGGINAAATPVVSGEISSFVVTNEGSGYFIAPTVAIGAGVGSGAAATATIDDRGHVVAVTTNGTVASVAVSGTSNLKYIDGEPVVIDGNAKAHLHVVNTVSTNPNNGFETITAQTVTVVVDNGGSGYTSEPSVKYPLPGQGAGLTFTPVISGASGGSGYVATLPVGAPIYTSQTVSFTAVGDVPTVTFSTNQYVSGVTVSGTGTGYENGAALVFNAGVAAGTVVVNSSGSITGVVLTNGGSYTVAPTITVAPPPTYDHLVTYSKGNIVISSGTRYVSLQSGNLNQTPVSSPLYWTALVDQTLASVMGSKIVGNSYVDGVAPSISAAVITKDRFGDAITQTAFHTGDFFTVAFTTTKPVVVVNGSGATAEVDITSGDKNLTYFGSNSAGTELRFAYQLTATDIAAASGVEVDSPIVLAVGTTINDAAGNPLTLSFTPPTCTAVTFN